jgi:hypothetical protein
LEKLRRGQGKNLTSLRIHGGSTRPEVWGSYLDFVSTATNVPRLENLELPELAASKQEVKATNQAAGPGYACEKQRLLSRMQRVMSERRQKLEEDCSGSSGEDPGESSGEDF